MDGREIEFRAFYKESKEEILNLNHLFISDLNREDLIIQQYTGLRDSQNNKIFEGDVVHRIQRKFYSNDPSSKFPKEEIWSVRYGYFGDPHKLYVHNHINSGREVICDIDELYHINNNEYVPTPHFFITETNRVEMVVVGNVINFV